MCSGLLGVIHLFLSCFIILLVVQNSVESSTDFSKFEQLIHSSLSPNVFSATHFSILILILKKSTDLIFSFVDFQRLLPGSL